VLLRVRARQQAHTEAPLRGPDGIALPVAVALLLRVLLASLTREELMAALLQVSVAAIAYVLQASSRR
jgi:hypothetical protein